MNILKVNEMTEMDLILCHLAEGDWDNFCQAWYYGLDEYKEDFNTLLLMANAILNHWEIPLYATDASWASTHNCFVWHFGDNTSPDYNNYKQ